jgi:5'-3' exonuclease
MNQQRARRFRSARDAKERKIIEDTIYLDLIEEGLVDPDEPRVCLTLRFLSHFL